MICTECGQTIASRVAYIAGRLRSDGRIGFFWACEHNPAGEFGIVALASNQCAASFVSKHPEYERDIDVLLEVSRKAYCGGNHA